MELTEKFLNLFDREDKIPYLDIVYNFINSSYKGIGGNFKIKNKEDLLRDNYFIKLYKSNGKPLAVAVYKLAHADTPMSNRKIVAYAQDGSEEGKQALAQLMKDDSTRKERQTWGEVSGAVEHYMIDKYGARTIPNVEAKKILAKLGKKVDKLLDDGIHYIRKIGDTYPIKCMIGFIPSELRDGDEEKIVTEKEIARE